MSADGDSDALSGLVGGGESSGLTPAGQSPPSVWPPPMPASQTVGGFLSSQEMAEGQAVVPPEAQVMALNAHFRDGGRIFGEDHGKFIKALSKYIPWMSKTLAGGTVDDQIPCVGIDRTCESDTKKVLEDAGLPRLEKMPAFCLKDIALTGSREGEVIQALSEIPKNTIIGAIGGAVGLRPRSSTYNQINNEKCFPRLFGVECKEKNLFLHLYNGGNSIFYYLSHACSPVNAIALPSMSAPCKEHGVEEKTLKVMTIAQHANPLTPNVRLEFATVGNTLYCFVKATRNLVAKDVLRLDWRCYAELQEKWHGPPKEVCNCGAKECRQVRVGSKNPAYFWSATKRFIAFPKGHHVQLLRPITSSNKEVAEHRSLRACATIPGLARPLHPGDFVVILFPDGDEEESRPAQVVYIEDKPTPMSKQAFFTYRLCEWAANDRLFKDADKAHPRGIYLTPTLWEFNHIFIRTLLPVVVLSRKESAEACNVSCSSLDVYVQGWATNRGDPGDAGDAEEFLEHGDEPMSPDVLTHFVKGGAGKRTVGDVKAVAWGHEYIEPPAGFFRPAESRVKGERDSRATKGSPIEIDSDGLEIEKLHDSDEVGYDEDLILKLQRAVKALPTLENIKTAVDELLQEHLNTTAAAAPAPGKRGESSKGKRGESSKGKQGESSPQKRVATPAWATELTTLVTTGFGATCTANLAEQILRLLQDPRDQAPKWKVELEKLDAILKHTVPTTEEVANMVIASNNDVKSKFEQRFEDERTSSSEHQDLLSKVLQEVRNLRSELRLLQSQTAQPSQPPSINYWAPPYHGQGLQMIPQQWAPSEPQFSPTPTPLAIIPAAATPSQKMTFAAPSLVSPAAATPSQFMAASTATPSHVMPGAMATRTIPAAIAASPVMPAAATPPVAATASPVMLVGTPSEEVRTQKRKFGDGESTSDAWMNWFADFGVVDAEKIPAIVHMLVKLNCRVETCSDGITRDLVYEECQRHGLAPVALKRVQLGLSTYAKLIQ